MKKEMAVPSEQEAVSIAGESPGDVQDELINEESANLSPAQEAQLEAYTDNATIAVYSEKTQPTVLQLLQSGKNHVESLSRSAFFVHQQLQQGLEKTGERMTEQTLMLGSAHLVSELVVLAEAAGLFTLSSEERLEGYRQAVQMYFREGLRIFKRQGPDAPGAVDPVRLQEAVEPLLTDQQKKMGMQWADQSGISKTAPASSAQAMELPAERMEMNANQPQGGGLLSGGMQ